MRNTSPLLGRDIVDQASAWFIEFRAEQPSQAVHDRFNVWLRASPQHIQAYLEVAAAWSDLPDADPQGRVDIPKMIAMARASADNVVHFERPANANRVVARAPARVMSRRYFAVAASVTLAIAGALGWQWFVKGAYSTEIGEQRSLTLEDGSSVELNAHSAIRVRYDASERRIELLKGQALFHVAKDSARPFLVSVGDTQVRAVGTAFDVNRKQSGTVVSVVEGRVAVSSFPSVLEAGEQLAIKEMQVNKVPRPDITAATAWTHKRLVFEDTPLSDVAEEFNRYNKRRLVIDNPALQTLEISGLYSSTDPASLLAFLRTNPSIVVKESPERIEIQRRP